MCSNIVITEKNGGCTFSFTQQLSKPENILERIAKVFETSATFKPNETGSAKTQGEAYEALYSLAVDIYRIHHEQVSGIYKVINRIIDFFLGIDRLGDMEYAFCIIQTKYNQYGNRISYGNPELFSILGDYLPRENQFTLAEVNQAAKAGVGKYSFVQEAKKLGFEGDDQDDARLFLKTAHTQTEQLIDHVGKSYTTLQGSFDPIEEKRLSFAIQILLTRGDCPKLAPSMQARLSLMKAISSKDVKAVQLFIKLYPNYIYHARSNLSAEEYHQLIQFLLDYNCEFDVRRCFSAVFCKVHCFYRDLSLTDFPHYAQIMKTFSEIDSTVTDIPVNNKTLLYLSIHYEQLNLTSMLLNCGANVNGQDQTGYPPLHMVATIHTSTSFLPLLLNHGADVNGKARNGDTPLHISVKTRAGCDFPYRERREVTYERWMLHNLRRENLLFMRDLVTNGADVNIQNNNGDTPLHIAVRRGDKECVKTLLSLGAKVALQNSQGKTPIQLALDNRDTESAGILLGCVRVVDVTD
jgi:ankyrin repeat protein